MTYGAWYSDILASGQQALQQTGQQLKTGLQTAAQTAVSQTSQAAQKAVTGTIQKGTEAVTQKIGVKPAPAPAPAPTLSIPEVIAEPVKAVVQTAKKAPIPTALILAAAGFGVWWFFIRKK